MMILVLLNWRHPEGIRVAVGSKQLSFHAVALLGTLSLHNLATCVGQRVDLGRSLLGTLEVSNVLALLELQTVGIASDEQVRV